MQIQFKAFNPLLDVLYTVNSFYNNRIVNTLSQINRITIILKPIILDYIYITLILIFVYTPYKLQFDTKLFFLNF